MSSSERDLEAPKSFAAAWTATVVLLLGFVLALLIFPPLYEAPKSDASSLMIFIGRFHPILLHLPVGALIFLVLLEVICSTRRGEEKYGEAALLALLVGAAGSVLAVIAGILLSREGGYVGPNFSLHQTMGLIGTCGVLLSLVVRVTAMGRRSTELLQAYRALFVLSFGVLSLGAHFGGNMSHGSKFLTDHAPEPLKSLMISSEKWMLGFVTPPKPEPEVVVTPEVKPEPKADPVAAQNPTPPPTPPTGTAGDDKLVFQHIILPIFDAKCNKCHSEEKAKGELRLDNYEVAMKGGENAADKNIVPGKPDDSVTFQVISSPEDDSDHMPPEGKEQLTPEETSLIKWWIQQGASNTQTVGGAAIPAELQATVDAILKG